jgi:hypothetical protein
MKLAISRLKEIIREEIAALSEAGDWAAASKRHGAAGSALRNPYGSSASAAAEKITGAEGQELKKAGMSHHDPVPESRVTKSGQTGTIISFYKRKEGRATGEMMAVVRWDNDPNSREDHRPGTLYRARG